MPLDHESYVLYTTCRNDQMITKGLRTMPEGTDNNLDKALADLTPERVERNQQIYADVVAKYYGDPDFKAKVDADPTRVLKDEGLEIPEGANVKLLFNTEKLLHIVLPAPLK